MQGSLRLDDSTVKGAVGIHLISIGAVDDPLTQARGQYPS